VTPQTPLVGNKPKSPRRPPLTMTQVAGLVGLVAVLLIIIDINQRLGVAQRLRTSADRAATTVAQLEVENAVLKTQVAYATTDAAVIAWAHESGKLVQPGEVLVVPVVPTPLPTQPPPPAPTPAPPPNWQLWWNVFFESALLIEQ
jgi:hypothetical protein